MKEKEIYKTLAQYKKHIEDDGYIVYAIMLKGSQNYNLDDEESDIDANAILIPKLHQITQGKLTKKYEFETGEVTCHDIYSFTEIVLKGNPQWIEVCHTPYKIGGSLDIWKHIKINPSALKGMVWEKVKAFDKLYPSREKYVKEFGYDPKQLHHIIRLYDLLKSGEPIYKYEDKDRDYMIEVKRGRKYDMDRAFKARNLYNEMVVELCEELKLTYKKQDVDYNAINKIVLQNNKFEEYVDYDKILYRTISSERTFGNDLPQYIKKRVDENLNDMIKGKDVNINLYIEIEEL